MDQSGIDKSKLPKSSSIIRLTWYQKLTISIPVCSTKPGRCGQICPCLWPGPWCLI